ncbi:MAG: Bug family tripartite tricarboxylate transporter substrate binding protein [Xanthobacteraceae bacterium]
MTNHLPTSKFPKRLCASIGTFVLPASSRSVGRRFCAFLRICVGIALAVTLAAPGHVHAQGYPAKTIKLIVPFGPGGPTDVSARLVAQIVQAALGQGVVIENRPGAGGATGTKAASGADPDGSTLLLATSATLGVVPALVKNPGYDPIRSFAPIAKIADSTLVLVVPSRFPANTVQEFVGQAKASPGRLSYASAGAGNQTQLLAELFKSKAGIDVTHVPYKSGAEMVTAILGEQVQMAFPDISILLPLIREGKLKALAVSTAARHPQLPDVPTMVESGIPDFVLTFWSGVVAPAGTPASVIDKLNAAINDGLKSPQMRESLDKVGAQADLGSPQDFARFIAAETVKWGTVAKTAGIGLD